ncbi:MAG: ATP-dependent Clp protease adaptor protein ClpS [Thermoanaerobaculia bacterium]|jgi:ATP-dependent Clp protease adaptor protein ClpS|nr:ATP-dependent Clp protease adaptor protein ClpS [Thermoanaerobaculia bacterium]
MLPMSEVDEAPLAESIAESNEKTEEPPLFKVLLHNDDYTTMEFVVWVLESVFNMPEEQAIQVMLNVHITGVGVAGIYTFEVAEMKVEKTTAVAREQEYPLLATMERA